VLIFLLASVALKIQLYSGSSLLAAASTLGTGFVRPSSEKNMNFVLEFGNLNPM
jgi:hypothetical protein